MRRDGDDRDDLLIGAAVPKHSPSRRSFVFNVALPDVFAPRACKLMVLVGVQTRMSRIGFQKGQALSNPLEFFKVLAFCPGFEGRELVAGLARKSEPERQLRYSPFSSR